MEFNGFCEKGFEDLLQNMYIQQIQFGTRLLASVLLQQWLA